VIVRLLSRISRWMLDKIGGETLLLLGILLVILGSVTTGLSDSVRGLNNSFLFSTAAVALLLGWVLARTRSRGWHAGLISIFTGLMVMFYQVGRLGRPIYQFLADLNSVARQILYWRAGGLPDTAPLILSFNNLWFSTNALLSRMYHWVTGLFGGQGFYDLVATALVWGLAVYLVAFWSGWILRRRSQPLLACLPAGFLLAATLNYSHLKSYVLMPFLAGALFMMAVSSLNSHLHRWAATGVDYSEDIRTEIIFAAAALAFTIPMLASLAPSLSIPVLIALTRPLTSRGENGSTGVRKYLGLKQDNTNAEFFAGRRAAGLPRSHLMGSGPELSDKIVMTVQLVPGPSVLAQSGGQEFTPNFYWRSMSYDQYTGRGWLTSELGYEDFGPGESLPEARSPSQREIKQYYRLIGTSPNLPPKNYQHLVYSDGELLTVDHKFKVAWRSSMDVFGAVISESAYQTTSLVTEASEGQLVSAGENYPQWVAEHYLSLPTNLPDRIYVLARDLTATAPTPYERAKAIESYLRSFPYTLEVEAPPAGHDVVDYFIFDLRKGYCDYYATSMVVLARAAGIPSRLVIGYASGRYDPNEDQYIVTEADAHSWVEIYFPDIGWIEFEPTAARPEIERSAETVLPAVPSQEQRPDLRVSPWDKAAWLRWFGRLWILVGISLVLLMVLEFVKIRRLSALAPGETIRFIYREIIKHAKHLAVPMKISYTPREFAGTLLSSLSVLASAAPGGEVLTPATLEIGELVELYTRTAYSQHLPDESDQERAVESWAHLIWRLRFARLIKNLEALRYQLSKPDE
jgi:transglutaminase-like putative cysteine protease